MCLLFMINILNYLIKVEFKKVLLLLLSLQIYKILITYLIIETYFNANS